MKKIAIAALLLVLVLTAGCLDDGLSGQDGDNETYPPGVTGEGVLNASALFDAHRAELRNTSYMMTATERFRINDTRRVITNIQKFPSDMNGSVNVTKKQADNGKTVLVLQRWGPDDEGLYYLREFTPQSVNVTFGASADRRYLGLRNYTDEVEGLVSEEIDTNQSVSKTDRGWNIEIATGSGSNTSLLVNESGFVHRFRLENSDARNHTFTLTYTKIESVDRPAWIDRARESIGFRDDDGNESSGNTST